MDTIKLSSRCLIFYLDETGHEELSDPNCPVFGIGGCAILLMYYSRFLEEPWKKMKAQFFNGESVAIHASDLKNISEEQMKAIGRFFKQSYFARFASIIKINSVIPDDISHYHLVASSLLKRIEYIASAYPLDSMALIFESSQRGDSLLRKYLSSFKVNNDLGQEIPVYRHVMSKDIGEAGLEVADCIIHTAGSQARQNIVKGKWITRKDYDSIFNSVPTPLSSYFEINSAEVKQ